MSRVIFLAELLRVRDGGTCSARHNIPVAGGAGGFAHSIVKSESPYDILLSFGLHYPSRHRIVCAKLVGTLDWSGDEHFLFPVASFCL